MLKHFLALSAAAFLLTAATAHAADAPDSVVGTILAVEGTATVQHGGQTAEAKVHSQVRLGDTVETGAKSKLLIMFIDDSEFTLGERAKFAVKDFVFTDSDKDQNRATYSIMNGAFGYISGLMTDTPDPDVSIQTRFGNIGIRGTTLFGGKLNGMFKLFLEHGLIDIANGGGGAELDAGEGTEVGGSGEGPADPKNWTKEEIEELKALVALKDWDAVLRLIEQQKAKNKHLRDLYKLFLKKYRKFNLRLRNFPIDHFTPSFPFIPQGPGGGGSCCTSGG